MQTTAGFFSFFGVRPIWVLPFAVAISMCEDVVSAAVFGSLSGLLCDLGSQALFGFNGLLVLCGCVAISLLSFFRDQLEKRIAFGRCVGGNPRIAGVFFLLPDLGI